jgi:hypothetical protein
MHTPGGEIQFGIAVLKMKNYSLKRIFERKLLFLLPFYIFIHEPDFDVLEKDSIKLERLKQEYADMIIMVPGIRTTTFKNIVNVV